MRTRCMPASSPAARWKRRCVGAADLILAGRRRSGGVHPAALALHARRCSRSRRGRFPVHYARPAAALHGPHRADRSRRCPTRRARGPPGRAPRSPRTATACATRWPGRRRGRRRAAARRAAGAAEAARAARGATRASRWMRARTCSPPPPSGSARAARPADLERPRHHGLRAARRHRRGAARPGARRGRLHRRWRADDVRWRNSPPPRSARARW